MSLKYLPVASEKTAQFHHRMIVKRKETKLTYLSTEKENCAVVDCEKCQCYKTSTRYLPAGIGFQSRERAPAGLLYGQGSRALIWDRSLYLSRGRKYVFDEKKHT